MSSASGYSSTSVGGDQPHQLPNEEAAIKVLCRTSEQALKRIEQSCNNRDKFLLDLMQLPEEQNRRLELLKGAVRRFEEAVYSGRLTNARNREHHLATMQKVCAYLEADPKQKKSLDKLESEVNKLLGQVIDAHTEYYKFEKRFDADDMLNRVQEMSYQVNIAEETFSKSQAVPLTPFDAILVLSNPAVKDEAESLLARLKEFSS